MQNLWNKLTARLSLLRRMIQSPQTRDSDAAPVMSLKRGVIYKGLLALAALALALVMLFTMTAAWYKNVVQTSGLVFHVDQWGLDSSVNIQDELIGAAPGDSGSIRLSVDNTSEGVISVTLGAGKGDLYNDLADMRKRLYFYIDDMAYRGGEHTPRVYLNSMETYSYTVLPEHNLILGDNGNAAPLMWEWVFDVVGYYFYGTVTTDTTASVAEYLRPVEYALDHATFRDGRLTTVDGTTTPQAFIEALSEEDGFAGTVTTTLTAADGRVYYPVSVDDEGEGVWIYLCNLGEIEYETMVDTKLGSAADTDRQFETYLHVTAQQKQLAVTQVATEDQLAAALSDNATDMVQLTGPLALSETLHLRTPGEKILDLNGYTLTSGQNYGVRVYEDMVLTVMNGSVQGEGSTAKYGICAIGGDIALSNVTVSNFQYGVSTIDSSATRTDSRLTMRGCTVRATKGCVYALGNGTKTTADTCVVIEDCLLESSGYYALLGNGSSDYAGTDVRVFGSTLRGMDSAIYHPQYNSHLYVEDSLLEAATPVVVKSGMVELQSVTINALTGTGYDELIVAPELVGGGFSCNGAGVSVETNYTYPCSVTIAGDTTITATHQDAVLKYEADNALFTITITEGRYSSDVSAFLPDGYRCVKDGDYWLVQTIE